MKLPNYVSEEFPEYSQIIVSSHSPRLSFFLLDDLGHRERFYQIPTELDTL